MRSLFSSRWSTGHGLLALLAILGSALVCPAGEPDRKMYWNVEDIRPGMKGTGQTVMVGTKLEEFGAEVLGVMRGVSPGRDMILCRLTGCNLEHAGIIQGMSGSPIYINGKLLGAVAFAWEFGKDPIAGVTPFEQMVQYVRSNDRRIAAEAKDGEFHAAASAPSALIDGLATDTTFSASPTPVSASALGGMRPIATPIAATGFSPRALAFLGDRFQPLGMALMAGGAAPERVIREEGDKPLVPGSPLSIAMVTGDFDLSGIGTVTHVEGNRVYGFGHPMFSLGACEFPMMTGYIHTVYPRASVSMKMGSPLKVVGVLDTDVSTGVAGHLGGVPDMIPLSIRVKTGRYSEPQAYNVQIVREPNLLATLVMTVLTNAIDTEGNLPEELTAKIKASIKLKGHDPIEFTDTLSGPRFTGQMGAANLFSPIASIVNILVRNPMAPIRLESIDCDIDITPGRKVATIESIRLNTDRLEPGEPLKGSVTIKPFKGERQTVNIELPLPADIEEGSYEATVCDLGNSLRRRFRNEPSLTDPRDLNAILRAIHLQIEPQRTALYLHVPLQGRGLSIEGQSLPNLPGSARAVFNTSRQSQDPAVRTDLIQTAQTPYVVEGLQVLKFTVVKDKGLSLK
ncbi:SpoIVB peptidase S55 domain-containing protein [Singulisphaera sp. Ch08]|uniref:SpoIVB peptidase S55 domain-containing protein n=1 Tax=Singulisphaera sp. Ch08 TaxID=3120278 RepID=A0AAU7CFI0_9BACT